MALDTPATIAIIGAGPIGIEAALYARFLGYDVELLEQGPVAGHVRQWGHVRMFSPFSMNCSPLGLAALAAQDEGYEPPAPEALLTGAEWVDQYVAPLAATDLLASAIHQPCRVVSISRRALLKGDAIGGAEREEDEFRLLLEEPSGERELTADIVIDASGVFSTPRPCGPGGGWAVGERGLGSRICRTLPDVLGADRQQYAGVHTLVIGSGYSAATTIAALAELRRQAPATEVTWLVRHDRATPVARIAEDRLPARDEVAAAANAAAESGEVSLRRGAYVESLQESGARIVVRFTDGSQAEVDQIVSHVGYGADTELFRELQVHLCYATEGPMKLAAALMGGASQDCLDQAPHGAETLRSPEPHFYLLGAKSYGRNSQFLFQTGLQQIRELFALIGGRAELNLYAGAQSLPR